MNKTIIIGNKKLDYEKIKKELMIVTGRIGKIKQFEGIVTQLALSNDKYNQTDMQLTIKIVGKFGKIPENAEIENIFDTGDKKK